MVEIMIVVSIILLVLIYLFYQFFRNDEIYRIRINWIEKGDIRHSKYSSDFMFYPNKHNYFGLRFPKDKHYA